MSSLLQGHESLQELAKELNHVVPERYIQEPQDLEPVCNSSLPLPSIPIIDMKDLIKMIESNDSVQQKNLCAICNEWGIFQVKCIRVVHNFTFTRH